MVKAYCYLINRAARTRDEGATMVEYGLMVALIAVVVAVAAAVLGTNVAGLFTRVAGTIGAPAA